MALKIACQMDPIERIDIRGDSTFALLLEAQRRGHELFYYTPPNLALRRRRADRARRDADGRGQGRRPLQAVRSAHDRSGGAATSCCCARTRRSTWPTSPPRICWSASIPRRWWSTTRRSVRNAPEKIFVLDFLDLMPPTLVTRNARRRAGVPRRAQGHHRQAALRQWRRRRSSASGRTTPTSTRWSSCSRPCSASRSWCSSTGPRCASGDKRIILVDGEVAGAINRVPAADETRSNLHVGGTPKPTELTDARPGDLRAARAGAEAARPDLHRHRRDRRLSDRDQRHLADRHPAGEGRSAAPTSRP